MTLAMTEIENKLPFTAEEWDSLRTYFHDSVMATTSLGSLARNLGKKWPISGKDETPARYTNFSLEQLADLPEFFGKGNRLPLLYDILLQTKQLEDPFEEMVEQFNHFPENENEARSPLEKLGIPMDFPVEMMAFSRRTLSICREGGHETLTGLISFLIQSKTAVIMNEEFRKFLNCLNDDDAFGLAEFLPLRYGARGIHLAEAIGLIARQINPQDAATLIYSYKVDAKVEDWSEDAILPKDEALALISRIKQAAVRCFEVMPDQAIELKDAINSGLNTSVRYFVTLKDPELEALALAIVKAALDQKPRFKGLISRFLG